MRIIPYYRVSTKRQNLGLDAQREKVERHAARMGWEIVEEVWEKESGREDARPGLSYAIALCKKHHATLVAAKLDRISRDISFGAQVFFKTGIQVVALDLPSEASTDPLIFSVFNGLAQREAEMTSERTKAALAAKDEMNRAAARLLLVARGVAEEDIDEAMIKQTRIAEPTLWYPGNPTLSISEGCRRMGASARRQQADNNPANVAAANELRKYFAGVTKRNCSAAARHLNDMQLYTSRGVFHDCKSVKLLIQRYAI